MIRIQSTILAAAFAVAAPAAQAEDVKFGVIGGVTGPIAAMAPPIIDASRLALDHVNAQGGLLGGDQAVAVVGDSACNPQAGGDAATKVVNVDRVVAVVGAHCSGATLAAANTATIPAGIVLISPASTAPALTTLADNDTVFRTVPSDAFQGAALARKLRELGYDKVAVAYLNNDYGAGLRNSFETEFKALGGDVAASAAHEEGKASYRAELGELAKSGANTLVVFAYASGSGMTIVRETLENAFFANIVGSDGMKDDNLIRTLGAENLSNFVASSPSGEASGALEAFNALMDAAGQDKNAIFTQSGYDAAFLLALAYEHAGGDKAAMSTSLRAVASAPGEAILPGEWEKAKALIAAGRDIDYKGAAGDAEFDQHGDVPGAFGLFATTENGFVMDAPLQ